jgi:hypothetical protein
MEQFEKNNLEKSSTNFNYDFSWGLSEKLYNANLLIPMYRFLFSSVPMCKDITSNDLPEELKLDKNESDYDDVAKIYDQIQKINQQVINVNVIAQKYCSQQYVVTRQAQVYMDNLLELLISQSKEMDSNTSATLMQELEKLLNITNKEIEDSGFSQHGGMNIQSLIPQMILLLVFLINIASESSMNDTVSSNETDATPNTFTNPFSEIAIITDSKNNQLRINDKIYEIDQNKWVDMWIDLPIVESREQPVEKALQVFNEAKKKRESGRLALITTFGGLLVSPTGEETLAKIISEFNKKSDQFEKEAQDVCLELMDKTKGAKTFENFKKLTEIEQTKEKLEILNKKVMTGETHLIDYITALGLGVGYGIATGDISPATAAISHTYNEIESIIAKYLTNGEYEKETAEYKKIMKDSDEETEMIDSTNNQKFENLLYTYSRYYCMGTFQFQLDYKEVLNENDEPIKAISVVGDRVDYNSFLNYIQIINKNIELTIASLVTEDNMKPSTPNKMKALTILISLKERFQILEMLIIKLGDIVNFNAFIELNRQLGRNPGPDSLSNVERFFNSQLVSLEDTLDSLKQQFPMQAKILEKQKLITKEKEEIEKMNQEITMREVELENKKKVFEAGLAANSTVASAKAVATQLQSYWDIGTNIVDDAGNKFSELSQKIVTAAAQGPLGVLKGVGDFFSGLIKYLLFSQGGLAIIGVLLSSLWLIGCWQLAGAITFIKTAWGFIVGVVRGPFIIFYYFIKTPIGIVCKFVKCVYRPNNVELLEQQPPQPPLLENASQGEQGQNQPPQPPLLENASQGEQGQNQPPQPPLLENVSQGEEGQNQPPQPALLLENPVVANNEPVNGNDDDREVVNALLSLNPGERVQNNGGNSKKRKHKRNQTTIKKNIIKKQMSFKKKKNNKIKTMKK